MAAGSPCTALVRHRREGSVPAAEAAARPERLSLWPAVALAVVAASLEGCDLVTIAYCPSQKIDNGRIRGAWQHDTAVIDCDEGFEYTGTEVRCEEYDKVCKWHHGKKDCKTKVHMVVKALERPELSTARRLKGAAGKTTPKPKSAAASTPPSNASDAESRETAVDDSEEKDEEEAAESPESAPKEVPATAEVKCTYRGEHSLRYKGTYLGTGYTLPVDSSCPCRSLEPQVVSWVRRFYSTWNAHNGSMVAGLFAMAGQERSWDETLVGRDAVEAVNQHIFNRVPNATIHIMELHPITGERAAFVDVSISKNDGHGLTLNVTEYMEFTPGGEITTISGSLVAIFKMLPPAKGVQATSRLKVEGMPPNGDDLYLYKVFAPFGAVHSVLTSNAEDGTCTGTGFVKFMSEEDALKAIAAIDGNKPEDIEDIIPTASSAGVVLHVSMSPETEKKQKE